jgi:hypothetical protein
MWIKELIDNNEVDIWIISEKFSLVIQEAVATPSDEGYCQLVSDESDLC